MILPRSRCSCSASIPPILGLQALRRRKAWPRQARRRGKDVGHARRRKAIVTLAFVCVFLYARHRGAVQRLQQPPAGLRRVPRDTRAAFGAGILSLAQLGYTVATLVMGWVTDRIGVAASTYITLGRHGLASLLGFSPLPEPRSRSWRAAFVFGMNSVIITISVPDAHLRDRSARSTSRRYSPYSRMSGIIGCFGAAAVGACYDHHGQLRRLVRSPAMVILAALRRAGGRGPFAEEEDARALGIGRNLGIFPPKPQFKRV